MIRGEGLCKAQQEAGLLLLLLLLSSYGVLFKIPGFKGVR